MSNFKIGDKVLCVDDSCGWISGKKLLTKGNIYKISNTNVADNGRFEILINCGNLFWDASRFKKINYEFAENLLKEISESVNQKHLQN